MSAPGCESSHSTSCSFVSRIQRLNPAKLKPENSCACNGEERLAAAGIHKAYTSAIAL